MKLSMTKTVLIALALGMSAGISSAAEAQPQKAKPASAAATPNAAAKKSKPAPPRAEPVDINSASKEELKKLPGIGDAEADRIIAGRPYLTKAHLQTRNIIPSGVYLAVSPLVVAKQKDAKFLKEAKK